MPTGLRNFFKISDGLFLLAVVAGAGRELAEAQRAHLSAESLLGNRKAELVPYPLCQIDEAPTDHPMCCGDWTRFDLLCKSVALCSAQDRDFAGGLTR